MSPPLLSSLNISRCFPAVFTNIIHLNKPLTRQIQMDLIRFLIYDFCHL